MAVFDEMLSTHLMKSGHEVMIVDNLKPSMSTINVLFTARRFNADVIISSLWYSVFFIFFGGVTKIHLLHGFTNLRSYSFVKFLMMILYEKLIRIMFDYVLANSSFTKLINSEMFGLNVDGVYHIGLSQDTTAKLKKTKSVREKKILYVGRLVKAKNVSMLISQFMKIESDDYELEIIGYGPEEDTLKNIAANDNRIKFIGAVPNSEIEEFYRNSDVFVSLNPSEPYGITFLEALSNGMYVIAPTFGGQTDILSRYENRFTLVNLEVQNEILEALLSAPSRNENFEVKVSIEETAEDILRYVK